MPKNFIHGYLQFGVVERNRAIASFLFLSGFLNYYLGKRVLASTYNPTEKGLASGLCSFRVPKKLGGTVTTEVSFQLIILV
jgi:hypothetical protein